MARLSKTGSIRLKRIESDLIATAKAVGILHRDLPNRTPGNLRACAAAAILHAQHLNQIADEIET